MERYKTEGMVLILDKEVSPIPKGAHVTIVLGENELLIKNDVANLTLAYSIIVEAKKDESYKKSYRHRDEDTYFRIDYIPNPDKPTVMKNLFKKKDSNTSVNVSAY